MDNTLQTAALLQPNKSETTTLSSNPVNQSSSTRGNGNEGIVLDVLSAETRSGTIPLTQIKPDKHLKQTKSIEDLRKELMILKAGSQDGGPASSLPAGTQQEAGNTAHSKQQRRNTNFLVINEANPNYEGPTGGVKTKASVEGNEDSAKQSPLMQVHGIKQGKVTGDCKVSDKDKLGLLCKEPSDKAKLPAGNTLPKFTEFLNQSELPPHQLKSKTSADVGPFPSANTTKTSPSQLNDPTNTNQASEPISKDPASPNKPTTKSWASLFNSNRIKSNGLQLEFISEPSSSSKQKPSISIPMDEVQEELERWNNALIGYVIGVKPPYKLMKQFVERRWKSFGQIETLVLRNGVFLFNFEDEQMKQRALEMGPWSYYDKPLILKPWTPNCSYEKEEITSIPIWVRFPHLKLHLWSAKTLSRLSSQIGQPLFTDSMTATKKRLAYARVCVEISMNAELPQEIEVLDHDGTSHTQSIEYEWTPTLCSHCKSILHGASSCPKMLQMTGKNESPSLASMALRPPQALLHPFSSSSPAPVTVSPYPTHPNDGIVPDVSSLEVTSQAILTSRSAPPSPTKLCNPAKKPKTIEDLRNELAKFKVNSKSEVPSIKLGPPVKADLSQRSSPHMEAFSASNTEECRRDSEILKLGTQQFNDATNLQNCNKGGGLLIKDDSYVACTNQSLKKRTSDVCKSEGLENDQPLQRLHDKDAWKAPTGLLLL